MANATLRYQEFRSQGGRRIVFTNYQLPVPFFSDNGNCGSVFVKIK